jgi:hypothetical protein
MDKTALDRLINVGCNFDWITLAAALLGDFLHDGPVEHFGVMAGYWTRGDIKRLLAQRGVKSWGYVYNVAGDMIMFSVPQAQAGWANHLLRRAGVPVLYAPVQVATKKACSRPLPHPSGYSQGSLVRWIGELI